MKIGKKEGCIFEDIIDIELSPRHLENLVELTEKWAMDQNVQYYAIGERRVLKDLLQKRLDDWKEAREKKDKEQV